MTDLRERFQEFEHVSVPDLWDRISDLAVEPVPRQPRRSRLVVAMAASVAVLLAIGLPLVLLGSGDDTDFRGEPTSSGWETVPANSPWDQTIVDAVQIRGSGFLVLTSAPSDLVWSPDGAFWFDADPRNQLPDIEAWERDGEDAHEDLVAAGDSVLLLDRANIGVWVGDRATGNWELIRLDGGGGETDLLTIGSNGSEVLVIGRVEGSEVLDDPEFRLRETAEYAAWRIRGLDADRIRLPIASPEWASPKTAYTVWYDGGWLALLSRDAWTGDEGWETRDAVLTSPDGKEWSVTDRPEEWGDVTSLTAGPSSVIVTTCHFGGDSFWYSTDGVTWYQSSWGPVSHQSAYVADLGFVVHSGNLWMVSVDGSEWQYPAELGIDIEPYPKASFIEERAFLYNNALWIWSEA